MEDYVKRFFTKDKKERITIMREDCADNPRHNTDEPLHCEDWARNYSIMIHSEHQSKSLSARDLIEYLLRNYGKRERIIDMLVENGKHMTDGMSACNNALVYDRSMKRWVLMEFRKVFGSKESTWEEVEYYDGRKDDIDLDEMLGLLLNSTIDELCNEKYWTDEVRMASYSFGYYGEITFSDDISCDSDGICWLEKDEFLKYSGCDENKYWKGKTLRDIEWLTDELEAWGDNEVYGFKVEKAVKTIKNVRYPDGEHDDTETEETEWEETGSCWGFYGELDKSLECILDSAGYKKEELIEE